MGGTLRLDSVGGFAALHMKGFMFSAGLVQLVRDLVVGVVLSDPQRKLEMEPLTTLKGVLKSLLVLVPLTLEDPPPETWQ